MKLSATRGLDPLNSQAQRTAMFIVTTTHGWGPNPGRQGTCPSRSGIRKWQSTPEVCRPRNRQWQSTHPGTYGTDRASGRFRA